MAEEMLAHTPFERATVIAGADWEIRARRRGRGWHANANFELRGPAARRFVGDLAAGGFRSQLWRLFAIRRLAVALTRQSDVQSHVLAVCSADGFMPTAVGERWSRAFARQLGDGWGVGMARRLLTHLGLCVFPDLALCRGAVRAGLFAPSCAADLTDVQIVRRSPELASALARIAIDLARQVQPGAAPTRSGALLEVGQVLRSFGRMHRGATAAAVRRGRVGDLVSSSLHDVVDGYKRVN